MAVYSDDPREGLALRLVDEVDNRSVTMVAKRITGLVGKDHLWAVGFWGSQGYQLDHAIVRYVQNL